MADNRTVDRPMGMLNSLEDERSVVIKGEMYALLEPLAHEMRNATRLPKW
ncbi:MAG: hypothetical protein ACLFU8_16800 [Anaerolineales bacterium]